MIRLPLLLLLLVVPLLPACGQEDDDSAAAPAEKSRPANREALLQPLFDAGDAAALDAAAAAARAGGISEQAILEARFLFLVDQGRFADIAALAPEFARRRDQFRLEDSAIFAVAEDWQAVVEYTLALAALEGDDRGAFETHIKEAFWLSPRQAAAFAPHIERLRLEDAMAKVRIDFSEPLLNQEDRSPTSLTALAGDARHVLLHFWSPWSQECEAYLADFLVTSRLLEDHGVKVVSVLAETAPDVMPDAETFRTNAARQAPGAWILDKQPDPLARTLRIQNLPTAVLVDRTGTVLFNGHPAEDQLWTELHKAVPAITRPDVDPAAIAPAPPPAE